MIICICTYILILHLYPPICIGITYIVSMRGIGLSLEKVWVDCVSIALCAAHADSKGKANVLLKLPQS